MDPKKERIRQLLQAYTEGKLSRPEFNELVDWLHQADDDSEEEFADIWNRNAARDLPFKRGGELFENMKRDPRFRSNSSVARKQRMMQFCRIAAVLIACFSLAALIYFNPFGSEAPHDSAAVVSQDHELQPGGNKAVLELADGRALTLDDGHGEITMNADKVLYADGTVVDSELAGGIEEDEELILKVPRGGQYRVVLEDGTAVQLNAGSVLRYPVRFSKNHRQVYLEGEAFFEVAKDRERPFMIESQGTQVEVLGTSFNVSAYPDDDKMVTTVVTGSVKVSRGKEQVVLLPNQSATLNHSMPGKIKVEGVDIEQGIAWTKGIFLFDREDIPTVMTRIGRWYDADIELRGDFKDKTLGGTVSRYENVRELLNVLALTGHFQYKIEGRRIMIME